jgi:hypothetical protein
MSVTTEPQSGEINVRFLDLALEIDSVRVIAISVMGLAFALSILIFALQRDVPSFALFTFAFSILAWRCWKLAGPFRYATRKLSAEASPKLFNPRHSQTSDLCVFLFLAAGLVLCGVLVSGSVMTVMWLYAIVLTGQLSQVLHVHREIRRIGNILRDPIGREQLSAAIRNLPKYLRGRKKLPYADRPKIEAVSQSSLAHKNQSLGKANRLQETAEWTGLVAFVLSAIMLIMLAGYWGSRVLTRGRPWTHQLFGDDIGRFFDQFGYTRPILAAILVLIVVIAVGGGRAFFQEKYESSRKEADRHTRPSVEFVLTRDNRNPFLFLRSFKDDSRNKSIEQSLAILDNLGPLIALGSPQDELPEELGAYRSYVDDDKWKQTAIDYMERARMILLFPATSRWIEWELITIVERGLLYKTAFIFPLWLPVDEKRERLKAVRERAPDLNHALSNLDVANTVILHFFNPSAPTNIVSRDFGLDSLGLDKIYNYALALALADECPWTPLRAA